MCGILGGLSYKQLDKTGLDKSLDSLSHRGPDSINSFLSNDKRLYFGHTRLAILDLSHSGSQPMLSSNHRFVITYNGEVYNFNEIKSIILKSNPQYSFRGSSDTEVILAAIENFGFENSLKMMRGMFALGCWDNKNNKLYLARDRLGEKPLYYGYDNETFFFSSELKALSFFSDLRIDHKGLNLFLAQGNIPAPFSIFKSISKLEPGTYIEANSPSNFHIRNYWSIDDCPIHNNTFDENYNVFQDLFLQSVESQMISDVSLGAFLSGGLDSSAVVSAMKEVSSGDIDTHTIGYEDNKYDESNAASAVAKHLGTKHHEFILSSDDAKSIIPQLSNIYCEPFSDSSQIPTFFLSKQTRTNVTVSLSGDGGDEFFGGYNRYIFFNRFQKVINLTPYKSRKVVATLLTFLMSSKFSRNLISKSFQSFFNARGGIEKIEKISKLLKQNSIEEIYFSLLQQWHYDNWPLTKKYRINPRDIYDQFLTIPMNSFREMRLMDIKNYLPNDILVKLDRASMSVSLESRVPFLDHRLVEFAMSLPNHHLVKGGKGKLMIRRFLEGRIPNNILNLPKTGFGVPIQDWLQNDLKSWSREIIFSNRDDGLFDYNVLENVWNDHQEGIMLRHHQLWSILMLKLWLEKNQGLVTL